jgi:hypothetical protein
MAYLLPPPSVGFVHNPNLVLPTYIVSEVVRIQDTRGVVWTFRRPRPLSIVCGAQIVLQCDRELLQRYCIKENGRKETFQLLCIMHLLY